jgi:hypothetical protein
MQASLERTLKNGLRHLSILILLAITCSVRTSRSKCSWHDGGECALNRMRGDGECWAPSFTLKSGIAQ